MVYRFVVLSDEDEAFVREFEFLDSHSLLDFHNALQDELEFDRSQIASFFMATESWEKRKNSPCLTWVPVHPPWRTPFSKR